MVRVGDILLNSLGSAFLFFLKCSCAFARYLLKFPCYESKYEKWSYISWKYKRVGVRILRRYYFTTFSVAQISCKEYKLNFPETDGCWILVINMYVTIPPIYLHSIFAIFQFEISSLTNLIFSIFQTWILQATAGRKIQFKPDLVQTGKKIQFVKLDISNWRIAKMKCR